MNESANTGCPEGARSVAWAYGEESDAALDHIVRCAECTQMVAEIEQVEAAVSSFRPALVSAPKATRRWPVFAAVFAVAAAAMVVVGWPRPPEAPIAPQVTTSADFAFQDDLDDRLDDLDASLDGLDDPDLL